MKNVKEISEWIKKAYEFKEVEYKGSQFYNSCRLKIVGFVYKGSYCCEELRRAFKYTPYTFQHLLDKCIFEGDLIFFNKEIGFSFSLLSKFIWIFNPKYAIVEVCLNNPIPMIVSAPNIPFEMISSPTIEMLDEFNKLKDKGSEKINKEVKRINGN